jgi:predicted transcriptional regulator
LFSGLIFAVHESEDISFLLGEEMNELEKQTIQEFIELAGKLTITDYGKLSGIERTRFFRLVHGADMKVKEFVALQSYIKTHKKETINWSQIMGDMNLKKEVGNGLAARSESLLQFERTNRLQELIDQTSEIAA